MASRLLRKTLTTSTRYLTSLAPVRVSPPAVQKTVIPLAHSVAAAAGFRGPSATVCKRMFSVHQPEPELEEKVEAEIEEESKKEISEKQEENKITDVYNTSQKILIACVEDFGHAFRIAYELGDARNIVVISQNSCGEMKRLHEHARWQMLELEKLGATVVFNVDFKDFPNDSRIDHTIYDIILLDL